MLEVTTTAAAAVAAYLAQLVANALLFGLSFLLILLVWFLVSRALDLPMWVIVREIERELDQKEK